MGRGRGGDQALQLPYGRLDGGQALFQLSIGRHGISSCRSSSAFLALMLTDREEPFKVPG
jgi:hypothetical protein